MNKYVRKDLQGFQPYSTPLKPFKYKMDANESPYSLSKSVKEKMVNWLLNEENFNIYPDTDNTELRKTIAEFYNISPENVTCGVGSDQLIDYITKVFVEDGDYVIVEKPSFSMYGLATIINKGRVIEVSLDANFQLDADKIIEEAKNNVKVIFLCTPNNPTGNCIDSSQVIKIIENVDCVVVVDEAYAEFSNTSFIDKINNYNNLIVMRTFSKAYGLAGARVGYAIACTQLIEAINIVKPPFNLPTFSQIVATEVLKDSKEYKQRIESIYELRKEFEQKLYEVPYMKIYPSESNFVLIDSKIEVADILEQKGVLVRKFSLKNSEFMERIRISVGTKEQNDYVANILLSLKNE